MKTRRILGGATMICLLASSGIARIKPVWNPEGLTRESSFVCNGMVLKIVPNGEKGMKWDVPTSGSTAEIKLLKSFKGNPVSNIVVLRYFHTDERKYGNGPDEICLLQGKRYRFYLSNAENDTYYVPCRATRDDDGDSVEPLSDGEPDDSRPYSQAEVSKLAEEYIESHSPGLVIDTNSTFAGYYKLPCEMIHNENEPPVWVVDFECRDHEFSSQTNHTSDGTAQSVRIRISSDGSIRLLKPDEAVFP